MISLGSIPCQGREACFDGEGVADDFGELLNERGFVYIEDGLKAFLFCPENMGIMIVNKQDVGGIEVKSFGDDVEDLGRFF